MHQIFRMDAATISAWRRNANGTIAIKFALMVPALLAASGLSIDVARLRANEYALQQAADAAALAAAKELSLSDRKREDLSSIANAVVAAFVSSNLGEGAGKPQTATKISDDGATVEVTAKLDFKSYFGSFLGSDLPQPQVRAVASVLGQPNICVLGLNIAEIGTISLEKNARVTGQNCAVFSNSTHNSGLKSKNSAQLTADFICSRGGKDGGPGNFVPEPLVDCPEFEDPLASRPEPNVDACDPSVPKQITGTMSLVPGTYCGLEIMAGADVTLKNGIYVIKDGPLIARNLSKLNVQNAGLFFTGAKANFTFEAGTSISMTAPESGPMAGLLIFSAHSQDPNPTYSILSDDARTMVGTIYIPKGELRVDATSPIADQSAYTAIVADKMRLYGGPHLILNTNYDDTVIPVPDGIRGAGQASVLVK